MAKSNVIITFSDSKYGNFLVNDWLSSLKENVDLKDTDIVVLDYGLNETQRSNLKKSGVKIIKCVRDGKIVVIRFRDMSAFLRKSDYLQVLECDGGDIIFQSNISPLFKENKDKLRAACEYYPPRFNELASFQESIDPGLMKDIRKYTSGKRMVNAGMLLGPRKKFIEMCDFCYSNIRNKEKFGPDQSLINYFLYKHGFVELDPGYNFIIYTTNRKFYIKEGRFFFKDGTLIPIVHNAGMNSFIRGIEDFGYGSSKNRLKRFRFYIFRAFFKTVNSFKK